MSAHDAHIAVTEDMQHTQELEGEGSALTQESALAHEAMVYGAEQESDLMPADTLPENGAPVDINTEESGGFFIPDDTNPPCVSVIINCYNGAHTLDAAMWSVLSQDFVDWEVIFWDNGSDDGSVSIVQGYAREYGPIIRPFRTESTCSLGAARNKAIEQSRGEYLAFLDCDDLWQPEKLSAQVALMNENPRVAIVCTDTDIMYEETSLGLMFRKAAPARGNVFAELVTRQWMSMSSVMIRRAALDELGREGRYFDERLHICEEAELFYTLAQRWECDYVEDALTSWHLHTHNTTLAHIEDLWKETSYILKKHQAHFDVNNAAHMAARDALHSRVAVQKAIALWQQGHAKEARAILRNTTRRTLKMPLVSIMTLLPPSCLPLVMRGYFVLETLSRGAF